MPQPHHINISTLLLLLVFGSVSTKAQITWEEDRATQVYESALLLMKKEQYISARNKFREYLRLEPESETAPYAQYYIALGALKLEESDADVLLNEFIYKYPEHPLAVQSLLIWGEDYFQRADYEKAISYLERVPDNRLNANDRDAKLYKLGLSWFRLEKYETAQVYFDQLKAGFGPYAAGAYYYAGFISYKNERYSPALSDLIKASESEEFENLTPILISNIYYEQGNFNQLAYYTPPLLNKNTPLAQRGDILQLTGFAFYNVKQYENAVRYFTEYLSESSGDVNPEARAALAFSQYQTGDFRGAAESFKPLAQENTDKGQMAAYYLGLCYIKSDKKRFAITALESARQKNYEPYITREASWYLARVHFDLGEYTESIEILKQYLNTYPDSKKVPEAQNLLGQAYLYSDNYGEALNYLEQIPKPSTEVRQALQEITYQLAIRNFNEENYQGAVQAFQKSLKYPLKPQLLSASRYWLAEAYLQNEQPREAIPLYQNFLDLYGNRNEYELKAHYGLAYANYYLQEYPKAIPHFQYYYVNAQGNPDELTADDALLRLSDCYFANRSFDPAVRNYQRYLQADYGEKDYAYFQIASIRRFQGENQAALSGYQTLIDRFPNSIYWGDAVYHKALIELNQGSFAIAIGDLSMLIKEKPQNSKIPESLLNRALAYRSIGNPNNAVNDYKKLVKEYPNHPAASSALFSLQEILIETGRDDELATILQEYREANPESQTTVQIYFENAKAAYFNQNYTESSRLFSDFIRTYPQSNLRPDAYYFLGESFYRQGNIPQAIQNHQKVIQMQAGNYLTQSSRRLADLQFAQKNYRLAIQYYTYLSENTQSKREQQNAWLGLMKSYYEMNNLDSTRYFTQVILERANSTKLTQTARLYQGKIAYAQQNYEAAKQIFSEVSQNSSNTIGAEAQYFLGDILFKQQKFDESLDVLFELNKRFGAYEKWRGAAFLLIADNYLGLGETYQARATLQSLIDNSPDPEVVQKAQTKLNSLPN